jgi:hypothetical protein
MDNVLTIQGRNLTAEDIRFISRLIAEHPDWSRRKLSEVLCAEWDWRNGRGLLKDMATRSLLLKLDARGLITLPARRRAPSNRMASRQMPRQIWDSTPVEGTLHDLGPLSLREISSVRSARIRFAAALTEFHYLGYRGTVGENLQYMVTDTRGRLLACLLFGSAAWKCRARDRYIGWEPHRREQNLHFVTNNTRFLIPPFVHVPHLASRILGQVLRRLSADWQKKYGHPIHLVETFVERDRFAGTSYRASNWRCLGTTTGRSRQDRRRTLQVPVKDIYVYPLHRRFRRELSS